MNEIQRLIHEMCPDGVPMVALGEICEIRGRIGFRGYTRADQVAEGEGALSLSPGNITNGVMDYSKGSFITWKKYEESPEIITNNGDIIFCKTASCGKVAIVKNLPYKATINPQLVVLKNVACPVPYLYYYLSSNSIQECVKKLQGVGSVPNISQATLSSFQIPFPPLTIQQRIVDILDKFTSLVSSLDSEIALRQKQYEFFRNKLLSFEEGDEGVEWKPLDSICEIRGRIGFRGYTREDQVSKGEGVISLSPGNIVAGKIDYESCTYITWAKYEESPEIKIFNGDILFCKTGSTVGKVTMVESLPCEATINPQLVVLKNIQINSIYLKQYLATAKLQTQVKALAGVGSVPNISQAKLGNLIIPVPSSAEQQHIANLLDTFESLLTNLKKERELRQKQYEYHREKLLTFA